MRACVRACVCVCALVCIVLTNVWPGGFWCALTLDTAVIMIIMLSFDFLIGLTTQPKYQLGFTGNKTINCHDDRGQQNRSMKMNAPSLHFLSVF